MALYGLERYPVKRVEFPACSEAQPVQIVVTEAAQEYLRVRTLLRQALAVLQDPDALSEANKAAAVGMTWQDKRAVQMGEAQAFLKLALNAFDAEDLVRSLDTE